MNVKKVLIFSLAYYPHVGGAEVAIKELTDRLADVEFHMLTLPMSAHDVADEQLGNVRVHRLGGGSASYLSKILFIPRAAFAARRLNKRERFDAAWAMMSYMVLPLVIMRLMGTRLPYVLNLQDGDPFERVFSRWYILPFRPLLGAGFRHARVVQALSQYLAAWAKRMGYTGPVVVVPQGVDSEHFSKQFSPVETAAFKQTLNKKEGDVFLLTTSRLVRKNGLDDVIRALPMLSSNVQFIVYGTGPEEASLKELAHALGVSSRVQFMGHIGRDDMPKYLSVCDIFVRPSRTEGFGISFVEAMAAGLPVIATQEGGLADFLFDKERNPSHAPTGFAVDKDAPAQIAAAVNTILEHPDEVRQVVENARAMVREKYTWDVVAKLMRSEVLAKLFV